MTNNLVIIGASHAGIGLIDKLKGKLPSGWKVTVIDPNSHFHWQIGSVRAVVDESFADKIFIGPLKDKFKTLGSSWHLVQDRVTSVDPSTKKVSTAQGQECSYDLLVVASGSTTAFPWKTDETADDPVADARATIKEYAQAIKENHKIIIGGAGAVGLEVTGEIVDLYKDKDVTLVDANSALLPGELGWHRNVGDRFESLLKAAGVKVKHNVKVTSPDISSSLPTEVTLSDGTKETALYLAATGVKPRTSFLPDSLLTERKFVDTKPTFQSTSESTIFALGDASNNERKLSLSIMSHVPVVANNLLKMMSDPNTPEASLQKYGGDGRTIMGIISFGKSAGGAQLGPVRLPSFLVAMLKGKDMMASRAAGLVR